MSERIGAGREVRFWSVDPEHEYLYATEIEEAVQEWFDGLEPGWPIPETVEVHGFSPMELPPTDKIAARVLEWLDDWLDDEYGDPDDYHTWSDKAVSAAKEFAATVREEYDVWSYLPVTKETVRVADYIDAAVLAALRPSDGGEETRDG